MASSKRQREIIDDEIAKKEQEISTLKYTIDPELKRLEGELIQLQQKRKDERKIFEKEREEKSSIIYDRVQEIVKQINTLCPNGSIEKRQRKIDFSIKWEEEKCQDDISSHKFKLFHPLDEKILSICRKIDDMAYSLCDYKGNVRFTDKSGNIIELHGVPVEIPRCYFEYVSDTRFKISNNPYNAKFFKKIYDHFRKQTDRDINIDDVIEKFKMEFDRKEGEFDQINIEGQKRATELSLFTEKRREESELLKEKLRKSLTPDAPEVQELLNEKKRLIDEFNTKYFFRCSNCRDPLFMENDGEVEDHTRTVCGLPEYTCKYRH